MEERAFPFGSDEPLAIKRNHLSDMVRNAGIAQGRESGKPRSRGAVAVIPIHGTLATFDDPWYGITSMVRIGAAFEAAIADKSIGAVVLHVDSPGGTVAGTTELADRIFSASGTKPIIAVADTEAASAAYWVASAADQLVVTPSGEVGSIGVWTMHQDISGMMKQRGVDVTLVSAGKYKTEGHSYASLDEEARAELQRGVDASYRDFVGAVARHRGRKPAAVERDFGQGRMLRARDALNAGMVDGIATFDQVLGELVNAGGYRGAIRQFAQDDDLTLELCRSWNGKGDVYSRYCSPERLNDFAQVRLANAICQEGKQPRAEWHYVSEQQKNEDELALARAEMAEFELDEMMTKYGLK